LRDQYLHALTSLADLAAQTNRYEQAAHYLQKILKVEPGHEEICIRLIDCLTRMGHRTVALHYIAACEKALAELGVSPSTQLYVSKEKLLASASQS
jgi:DNA-binding SARP family transcriptional activator